MTPFEVVDIKLPDGLKQLTPVRLRRALKKHNLYDWVSLYEIKVLGFFNREPVGLLHTHGGLIYIPFPHEYGFWIYDRNQFIGTTRDLLINTTTRCLMQLTK